MRMLPSAVANALTDVLVAQRSSLQHVDGRLKPRMRQPYAGPRDDDHVDDQRYEQNFQ